MRSSMGGLRSLDSSFLEKQIEVLLYISTFIYPQPEPLFKFIFIFNFYFN